MYVLYIITYSISVAEDDIGDPDDLDHGDNQQHSGVSYPGHSSKDLGKDISWIFCFVCLIVNLYT